MKKNSILLVEDVKILRETIAHDLEKWGYVVKTAENGEEGIRKFQEKPTDLVITDLIMEEVGGIQLSKAVKALMPSAKIIIHTGYPSTTSAIEALKLGAFDYLLKPCSRKELLKTIEKCLNCESSEETTIGESKISNLELKKAGLTSREIEVCFLIKKGMSNAEIASSLFISLNTAKNHIKRIHKKLEVTNRAQLVFMLNQ